MAMGRGWPTLLLLLLLLVSNAIRPLLLHQSTQRQQQPFKDWFGSPDHHPPTERWMNLFYRFGRDAMQRMEMRAVMPVVNYMSR